jgi:hypothetical protein
MLDIVAHQNILLLDIIVFDILDSHRILDHVKTKNLSEPVDKFTDCEWFQNLTSELISHKIEINSGEEAD